MAETDLLRIEHIGEFVHLINKQSGEILFEDDLYGDPQAALIDQKNLWAIVGGQHLIIWTPDSFNRITKLGSIHSLRSAGSNKVEVLSDPWAEHSAIWEIDTNSLEICKVRDFSEYRDKPYTDTVSW